MMSRPTQAYVVMEIEDPVWNFIIVMSYMHSIFL